MSVELRSFILVRVLFLSYCFENTGEICRGKSLSCFLMELRSLTGSVCAEGGELVLVTAAGTIHLKKERQFKLYISAIFSRKKLTDSWELDPLCGN